MCVKCKEYVASLRKVEEVFKKIILRSSKANDVDIKNLEDKVIESLNSNNDS